MTQKKKAGTSKKKAGTSKASAAVKNSKKTAKPRGLSFRKGQSGNPAGRPKGAQNKATADARAAIAKFVDGNAHRLQDWLDQIAEDDPGRAFTLPSIGRADNARHEC